MRRADRLFMIVQHLRGGRLVTARMLGERLEVSERTIYRDIADLQASGVPIDGEAGVGDVIRYTYTVTNTGSIPVADVFVSDVTNGTDPAFLGGNNPGNPPHVSLIDNGISSDSSDTNSDPNVWGLLAEDDAIVFQADYTVTQTDVEALQ